MTGKPAQRPETAAHVAKRPHDRVEEEAPRPPWQTHIFVLRRLLPAGFLLVVGAMTARELTRLDLRALADSLHQVALPALLGLQAVGLAALMAMALYDLALCRWLGIHLPLPRLLRYAWIANAFNNLVGLSGLTGSGIRYLLLTREGLSPSTAAGYAATVMVSISAGLSLLAWPVFLLGGDVVTDLPVPGWAAGLIIALVGAYLPVYLLLLGGGALHTRFLAGLPVLRVSQRLSLVAISTVDWMMAILVAWLCVWACGAYVVPEVFLVAFVLAATLGLASMIPGGLGVFDGVLLLAVTRHGADPAAVTAGILLYRAVYYLVPWLIGMYVGTGLLVSGDNAWIAGLARRWEDSRGLAFLRVSLRILSSLGVRMLAGLTFLAGIVLLVSAAFPVLTGRAFPLFGPLPLVATEGSHLVTVVVAVLLIGLSRGIAAQVTSAYRLSMALLLSGALFALLRGLDLEESLFLLVVAFLLRLRKRDFYRVAYPLLSARNLFWLVMFCAALAGYAALGGLLHGAGAYDHGLLLEFDHALHAPRFLRSLIVAALAALAFLGWVLFRMPGPPLRLPGAVELDEAKAFLEIHGGGPFAHLVFTGDKYLFYSGDRRALIQFGRIRDRLVSLGDPLGEPDSVEACVLEFRAFADRYDMVPVFHEVGGRYLHCYHDHGFSLFKLGETARVKVGSFGLAGRKRESIRHSYGRARREGAIFEMMNPPLDEAAWSELERLSNAWLADKSAAEKGFSLGRFDRSYLSRAPIAVVRVNGRAVAFASLAPTYQGLEELTVDLMRQVDDAPAGTMDFMFVSLIEYARAQGYRYFSLGMAPLSGVGSTPYARAGEKVVRLAYEYGNRFYNYKGLRSFKEKYHPQWQSGYLVYPVLYPVAPLLIDIAALIAGGYRRIFFKH